VTNYLYSMDGQLIRVVDPFETRYRYDAQGNKVWERDPNGKVKSWEYDGFGRMISSTDLGGNKTSYTYNLAGQLTRQTSSLGQRQSFFYDEAGHLAKIIDTGTPSKFLGDVVGVNRITEYGYDLDGRRVVERTVINGRVHQDNLVTFDALGRIARVNDPDYEVTYSYDGVGNRTSFETLSTAPTALEQGKTTYTVNGVNQYTAMVGVRADAPQYDQNGNTTSLRGMMLKYDDEDRLVEAYDGVQTVRYIYDGLGRRVEKLQVTAGGQVTGEQYAYDGWRIVQDVIGDTELRSYLRGLDVSGSSEGAAGIGGLLATESPSGSGWTIASYFYDGAGNVSELVSDEGAVQARYSYGSFGEALSRSGPMAETNRYQFSSKELDEFTHLYYFQTRYYSADLGRWMSRDMAEEVGGLNVYGYVFNCPNNFIDPFGLCATPAPDGSEPEKTPWWRTALGFVPVVGSTLDAIDAFRDGNIGLGLLNVGLAIVDATGAGALAKGLTVGAFKIAERGLVEAVYAEGRSMAWSNVRRRMATRGLVEADKDTHHWLLKQAGHAPDWLLNHPANLMPNISETAHYFAHHGNVAQKLWYGTPTWAKTAAAGVASYVTGLGVDGCP